MWANLRHSVWSKRFEVWNTCEIAKILDIMVKTSLTLLWHTAKTYALPRPMLLPLTISSTLNQLLGYLDANLCFDKIKRNNLGVTCDSAHQSSHPKVSCPHYVLTYLYIVWTNNFRVTWPMSWNVFAGCEIASWKHLLWLINSKGGLGGTHT